MTSSLKKVATVSKTDTKKPPLNCYIIRNTETPASRRAKEGLLIFSSEKSASKHMKNMGQGEYFYTMCVSWNNLVKRGSRDYDSVVLDYVNEGDAMTILPLK